MYLVILFTLFSSALLKEKRLFTPLFILVTIYSMLNYGFGYDWINYRMVYLSIHDFNSWSDISYEPGFSILMIVCKWLGLSYPAFSALIQLMVFSFCFLFLKKMKDPTVAFFTVFAFLAYYCFYTALRQGIAISMVMLAYLLYKEKKTKMSLLTIMLASSFHISALFSLVFLMMIKNDSVVKFKRFIILSLVFVFAVIVAFNNPSVLLFSTYLYAKFSDYSGQYSGLQISVSNLYELKVGVLYILFIVLFVCYKRLFLRNNNENGDNIYLSSIISIVFMLETKIAYILSRFQYYSAPVLIIKMDELIYTLSRRSIFRAIYICLIFIVGLIPMRSNLYSYAINDPLFFSSSPEEINKKIQKRCLDLYKSDPDSRIIVMCNR